MSSAFDMLRIGSSGFVSGYLQLAVLYEDVKLILKVWVHGWVPAHQCVKNRVKFLSSVKEQTS